MIRRIYLTSIMLAILSCTPVSKSHDDNSSRFHQLAKQNIENGEYLADIMLCTTCHSPMSLEHGSQRYHATLRLAGGTKIVTPPDGTFYAKNITPDVETAIGSWNFGEIARAFTQGIGKNGNGLRVMPYQYYDHLTNEDLNALIAYLQSIPPIYHKIPENEPMSLGAKIIAGLKLILPFVDNPSQDFYYGDFGKFSNDADATENNFYLAVKSEQALIVAPLKITPEIERGRYLVTISACAFCHTPVGMLGRQSIHLALAGGFKIVDPKCGSIYSKNITPDKETGLGDWNDEQIANAIRAGISKDGRLLCATAMPWQAYAKFSDADINAIIAYLRAIPPKSHKIPLNEPPTGEQPPIQRFFVGDEGV
ncbi:MAG: c-type cytochrome [Proteobacteria bacterium]|nr:c-type cytochrome [Pseudomonadota bacterium]